MRHLVTLAVFAALLGAARADTIVDDWSQVKAPAAPELKPVAVDPKTDALLVLDFNGHEAANSGPCNAATKPRCLASLPKVAAAIDAARAHGVYVVYSLPPTGSTGADIRPQVAPREGEPIVKAGPDKFVGSQLRELLAAKGIARVIVTGTASEGAVLNTAADAVFHGMSVIIPVDGMSSTEPYAEQYVAWHFAHAPGMPQKATLTSLDQLKF